MNSYNKLAISKIKINHRSKTPLKQTGKFVASFTKLYRLSIIVSINVVFGAILKIWKRTHVY